MWHRSHFRSAALPRSSLSFVTTWTIISKCVALSIASRRQGGTRKRDGKGRGQTASWHVQTSQVILNADLKQIGGMERVGALEPLPLVTCSRFKGLICLWIHGSFQDIVLSKSHDDPTYVPRSSDSACEIP